MTTEGLDYSYSRPSISQMAAAGVKFVVRYLSTSGKGAKKDEIAQLLAAGISVALVYESGSQMALGGFAAGQQAARAAVDLATSLGAPAGTAIYFAVDFDTNSSQTAAIAEFFRGAQSVIGKYKVGIYGEAGIVQAIKGWHATYGWVTYAWSNGAIPSDADLYQYQNDISLYGAQVDRDRVLGDADFGQWLPSGKASTTPTKNDGALIVNAADEAKVKAIVDACLAAHQESYARRTSLVLRSQILESLFQHSLAQGTKLQKLMTKLGVK